jgi:hypothetical protein
MHFPQLFIGFLACALASSATWADSPGQAERERAAQRLMATFCVTDPGLGIAGGAQQADGSFHFSPLIWRENKQTVTRTYDVSQEEMQTLWRNAYAEHLTLDELNTVSDFCRSDNASLRNALKKQRRKNAARNSAAFLKMEAARNPSLALWASAFSTLDQSPDMVLNALEAQALEEFNASPITQSALSNTRDKVYKSVQRTLWKIGAERGTDTPSP